MFTQPRSASLVHLCIIGIVTTRCDNGHCAVQLGDSGSCDNAGQSDKRLTLRVANGNGRVKVSVSDNGVGIPPENLMRIFNHGFTTKKDGHGFGLHSGANAAREMGGALTVHSEGVGRGATFTVELPLSLSGNNLEPQNHENNAN